MSENKTDSSTPETITSTEQPTADEQNVRPEDEAQGQKADAQARAEDHGELKDNATAAPENKPRLIGAPPVKATDADAPTYSKDEVVDTSFKRLDKNGNVDTNPMKDLSPQDQKHIGKLRAFAQVLAGGPNYTYKMDENGQMEKVEKPLSGGQIAMGLIAHILGGAAAGMSEHGPGSVGRSFGKGEELGQRLSAQKQAEEKQQQDMLSGNYQRKAAILQNNLNTHMLRMEAAAKGGEWIQNGIDLAASTHEAFKKLGGQLNYVWNDELEQKIKEDPQHYSMSNAIPVGREPRMDPKTGQPMVDSNGVAMWRTKYLVLDPNTSIDMPKDLIKKAQDYLIPGFTNGDGNNINLPKDPKSRALFIVNIMNQVEKSQMVERYSKELSGGGKEDKSTPDSQPDKKPIWNLFTDSEGKPDLNKLAATMAQHEGTKPTDRNMRNNNPGNLKTEGDAGKDADGFAKYTSMDKGKEAQVKQLQLDMSRPEWKNATAEDYINGKYSPDSAEGNGNGQAKAYADALNTAAGNGNGKVDIKAAAKKAGIEINPLTPKEISDLSETDKNTLIKLGGFSAFLDGTPYKDDSTADKRIQEKQVDSESVNRLRSMLTSKDGKLSGQPLIEEIRKQREYDYKAGLKQAEARGDNEEKIKADNELLRVVGPEIDASTSKYGGDKAKIDALVGVVKATEYKGTGTTAGEILTTANTLANWSLDPLDKTTTMRNTDRNRVFNLAKAINPNWNQGVFEQRKKVLDSYMSDKGLQNKQMISFNTLYDHIGDALDASENWKRTNVKLFNEKPLAYWSTNLSSDPLYTALQAAIEPVKSEFMTFLMNNHALTESDKKSGNVLASETMTAAQLEASLKQFARTSAYRLYENNKPYKTAFGVNFPDLLSSEAVRTIQKMNDPTVTRVLKDMESGGMPGMSADGAGKPGKKLSELLHLDDNVKNAQQHQSQVSPEQKTQIKQKFPAAFGTFVDAQTKKTIVVDKDGTRLGEI